MSKVRAIDLPKKIGRPTLPPEQRTHPRTIWMTDAEWSTVQSSPKGWVRRLINRACIENHGHIDGVLKPLNKEKAMAWLAELRNTNHKI